MSRPYADEGRPPGRIASVRTSTRRPCRRPPPARRGARRRHQSTDVDAAVRRPGVPDRGEVRRVVHGLSAVEEHRVRHRRPVELGHVVDALQVDVEDAFTRGGAGGPEPGVEGLAAPSRRRRSAASSMLLSMQAAPGPRDGAGRVPQVGWRVEVPRLCWLRGGRPGGHGREPIEGAPVDLAGHRISRLAWKPRTASRVRSPYVPRDVGGRTGRSLLRAGLEVTHLRSRSRRGRGAVRGTGLEPASAWLSSVGGGCRCDDRARSAERGRPVGWSGWARAGRRGCAGRGRACRLGRRSGRSPRRTPRRTAGPPWRRTSSRRRRNSMSSPGK